MHIPRWATREDGNKRRYTSFIIEVGHRPPRLSHARCDMPTLSAHAPSQCRCMLPRMTGVAAAVTVRQMRWPPQCLDDAGRSKEDILSSGGFTIS